MKITRTRKLLGVAPIVFAAIGTTSLADDSALCSEHPRCLATPQLPFEYCCPNSGGVFCTYVSLLKECFHVPFSYPFLQFSFSFCSIAQCCDTAKEKKARCNAHSSCEERGLTGFCCPTVEGEYVSLFSSIYSIALGSTLAVLTIYFGSIYILPALVGMLR